MPFVDTGSKEDKTNLSDAEFYRKHHYNKEGFSYGYPISERVPQEAEIKPDYGWWDIFKADFMSNPLVVYGQLYAATSGGEVYPNFRLTEENTRGFENDIGALAMAHNEFESNFVKEILKEKYRNEQVIADSNGLSWFTGKAAGLVFDPAFFGAGKIVSGANAIAKGFSTYNKVKGFAGKYVADVFGKDFAKTAGGTMLYRAGLGAVSGAAVGGVYTGIESLSEDVGVSDAFRNMATFAVLSSVFGGIIGANEARGMSLRRKKADKLIDEISKKQPTEIVVTSEEFEKFRKDPKLAEAKIKNAWGFENFSADPSIAGALSPSSTMKAAMSFLTDSPIKIVDGKTGELMTFTPAIESTVGPIVGQYLRKLMENIDEYYTKWMAEKGGNELLAKLNVKLWKGGNKYEEFCREWLNACYNPSSSSSAIINELVRKTSEEIIKPISDIGQKADVFGYKRAKDFELNEKKKVAEKELNALKKSVTKEVDSKKIEETKKAIEEKTKEIEGLDKEIEENLNKVYTHEDFRKLLDEYYFPRMYDTLKIAAHRDEAVADIKEGMWSISELRDLRNTPENKLSAQEKKLLLKEDEKLQQAAEEAVSHILHEEDKAFTQNPRKTRSFEHERRLRFSTEYVKNWIVQDPEKILANFIRTIPVDAKILERFGTLNVNDVIKLIKEDYKKLIENAVSDEQKKALAVQCDKDIDNFRCVWCRVRGINEYTSFDLTRHGIAFNHAANIINNLNVARLIGGTVISATSDVAQAMMTLGFKKFWKGYTGVFRKDFWKAFSGSEGMWLRAFDHFERTRSLGFYNQMIGDGFLSAVDNFTGRLANLGVKMSCINKWDEFNKFIVGYVTQEGILQAGEKLAKGGKLATKDLEFLSATGVTEENAVKMFEQFKKYGRISEGGAWESGVGLWDNAKLQDIFRGGVRKIQNQAILTPTAGSVPLIFDRFGSFGKMLFQFRRFSYSTYSKVLLPMLQKKDLEAFSGLAMMVSIGVMKAYLRALKGGYAITMADAIKQSLSEADCVAYMGDAYGIGSALLGFNDSNSKGNREVLRKAFGTGYDFVNTFATGIPGLFRLITGLGGDLNYGQIHAIRKLLPLQNNILLFPLFDKFEEVTIDKRGSKRAKKILRKKKQTNSEF